MAGKTKAPKSPVVVTASRLADGHVLWLTEAGWSEVMSEAKIFPPADAEAGLAIALLDEARQIVVGAYVTEAEPTDGGWQPSRFRERIRAHGPSIPFLPHDA